MKFYIHTLGCKVNQYESEKITKQLESAGFIKQTTPENCDVVIVNSCTVTAESDRKTRQLVRKLERQSVNAAVVLTGCMPQAFLDDAKKLPADIIVGNGSDRDILKDITLFFETHNRVIDVKPHKKGEEFESGNVENFDEHTRAYMKIEDGCDRGCTYCIIPKARGRVRSRSIESIKNEAEKLSANGFSEIVLVGINLSSYGKDIGLTLSDAVDAVSKPSGIKRIRFGSLEPDLTDTALLLRLKKNGKFCPQFHLALQSGCDETLRRMNRLYNTEFYKNLVSEIQSMWDNASITTDIMVGFTGESDEEFEKSLDFCSSIGFLKAHVFPYSIRNGTAAAGMDGQVDEHMKSERAKKMAEACDRATFDFIGLELGKTDNVLLETFDGEYCFGHSCNFTEVYVKCRKELLHKTVNVIFKEHFKNGVLAEISE